MEWKIGWPDTGMLTATIQDGFVERGIVCDQKIYVLGYAGKAAPYFCESRLVAHGLPGYSMDMGEAETALRGANQPGNPVNDSARLDPNHRHRTSAVPFAIGGFEIDGREP
jgi:hypothetical protein